MPAKKIKNKKSKPQQRKKPAEKPLTLSGLVRYNNKVFLPALELRFVAKKDFNEFKAEMYEFKTEMYDFKTEMYDFKTEMHDFKTEMYIFKVAMYEFQKETVANFDNIKTKLNDIANTLDYILKNTTSLEDEHVMQISTNQRVDKKIENHEKRINKLETAVKSA